jgi:hypothetical protein
MCIILYGTCTIYTKCLSVYTCVHQESSRDGGTKGTETREQSNLEPQAKQKVHVYMYMYRSKQKWGTSSMCRVQCNHR